MITLNCDEHYTIDRTHQHNSERIAGLFLIHGSNTNNFDGLNNLNSGVYSMVLIKLNSDNFEGEYLTPEAYNEVVLQMSTGDHATHSYSIQVCPNELKWHCFKYIAGFEEDGEPIVMEGDL